MGYSGGTKKNPTYYGLGDHAESIQVDYDPSKISYARLLDIFWSEHDPFSPSYSRQYMSMIHFHDEKQRRIAAESKTAEETKRKRRVVTEMAPAGEFYLAEDYHQKHSLRQVKEILDEYLAIYPRITDFIASTAVARANGYTARYGTTESLNTEIDMLGLSPAGKKKLLSMVSGANVSLR